VEVPVKVGVVVRVCVGVFVSRPVVNVAVTRGVGAGVTGPSVLVQPAARAAAPRIMAMAREGPFMRKFIDGSLCSPGWGFE
jgi:hypothetical protein